MYFFNLYFTALERYKIVQNCRFILVTRCISEAQLWNGIGQIFNLYAFKVEHMSIFGHPRHRSSRHIINHIGVFLHRIVRAFRKQRPDGGVFFIYLFIYFS